MLSFILLFCFAGCNDDDYSDDIDALKKELEETKASIKTIQDLTSALQNQLFINSYEKTENGYTLKMSDGSTISVTQGQKGEDGIDGENGTNAPTITDINETENALEFVFSDGSVISLPKEEKYDVITFEVTSTFSGLNVELLFSEFSGNYIGYGVSYPYPENLEINWGDGRITRSSKHEYKEAGTYTVTIKAKKIYGLAFQSGNRYSNIDISKCSNIQYLDLSRCEGDMKICNSLNLVEIDGFYDITKLNLENLPNLRCVNIGGSPMAKEFPLESLNIINCPNIEILYIPYTKLTSIDISGLKNLYEFNCNNSSISTIWVWEEFDPTSFDNCLVPEGVEYKVKQ
ncbi:PL29 family lyase N-terminal domain-containing protein [Butyricimonas synergistica]|uniref:PL29 family lyase N-terminal domain-containing protein n=1 Tax=Butyricimonas synergistica TaxID=544644 RepID=UPI0012DE47CD|nr:PL29 family lyase N-terminal domain-containing protein [Butyricimonas synergistica]